LSPPDYVIQAGFKPGVLEQNSSFHILKNPTAAMREKVIIATQRAAKPKPAPAYE
jgi:hypothetical protein